MSAMLDTKAAPIHAPAGMKMIGCQSNVDGQTDRFSAL